MSAHKGHLFRWRPQLADANDEMVLEAAVNGRADALVTHKRAPLRQGREDIRMTGPAAWRTVEGVKIMKASYPLKLSASVKAAAGRLAKEVGVSLNQWIAVAIAKKIGAVETASDFLKRRAGKARPEDMLLFLDKAKKKLPPIADEI